MNLRIIQHKHPILQSVAFLQGDIRTLRRFLCQMLAFRIEHHQMPCLLSRFLLILRTEKLHRKPAAFQPSCRIDTGPNDKADMIFRNGLIRKPCLLNQHAQPNIFRFANFRKPHLHERTILPQ